MNDMINKRLVHNREIVKKLSELVEKHPNWRFWQILYNYGVVEPLREGVMKDGFYVESQATLSSILDHERWFSENIKNHEN